MKKRTSASQSRKNADAGSVSHLPEQRCAACGGSAALTMVATDTNRKIDDTRFPYYHCSNCGWWFLSPHPPNLGAFYPKDYHAIPADADDLARRAESERYKIDIISAHRPPGKRLLEVGPSYGMFLHLARSAGFFSEGIEMDSGCCQFLRGLHFTIHHSDDPVSTLGKLEPFDVIALWHVIEHLPDPWAALAAMAERLKPGGLLVLAQPNPASLQFRWLGKYWTHLDAPRHLSLTPWKLLKRRMESIGLESVSVTCVDPGSLGWNRFGWVHSLRNRAKSRFPRFMLHLLARLIEIIVMPAERTGMNGSAYTSVFRKIPMGISP